MKRITIMAAALALMALGAACGDDDSAATSAAGQAGSALSSAVSEAKSTAEATSYKVTLAEQNASGESGTATIKVEDAGIEVEIELDGAPATAQPAHIHSGSCAELGDVVYPLENVVNGKSTTVVDLSLADLAAAVTGGGMAINVHQSVEDIGTYVACGDVSL